MIDSDEEVECRTARSARRSGTDSSPLLQGGNGETYVSIITALALSPEPMPPTRTSSSGMLQYSSTPVDEERGT